MSIIMDDLIHLFPNRNGISDQALKFYTLSAFAHSDQPKGIFIPLYEQSGELIKAIENGAIAALWNKEIPIPSYTPNQFIVFYTDDLWKGLITMVELYKKNKSYIQNERVTFDFLGENKRKIIENENDLDVVVKELTFLMKNKINKREGI